jgi:hypothetical protein
MPLHRGKSEKTVGRNIAEMRAAGHPEKQAVAAAEHEADMARTKQYGDMPIGKMGAKDRKAPALAMVLGDMGHDEPDGDEGDADDKVADDKDQALQAAGDAAIEALHANDGLSFAKALVAAMKAGDDDEEDEDTEAADVDLSDHDGGYDPPAA